MMLKINKTHVRKEIFLLIIEAQKIKLVTRKDTINKTMDGEGIITQLLPPAAKALITKPKFLPTSNKIKVIIIPETRSVIR
ncbi:MAG: hypothetical protein WKG06_33620 [Segetibacter sp.]